MENQLQTGKSKFEKLGRYYLIALGAIATIIVFNQVLVQTFISDQENDSRVVNLSGRQRMLSQQISKCALLLGTSTSPEKREQSLREMQSALQEWTDTHQGLQQGSATLGINGDKSNKIEELLKPVTSHHQKIGDAAEAIIQKLSENTDLPPEGIQAEIETITTYEGDFLRDMDLLVLQYENEAKAKVINLKNIELFLMVICLGVIVFEIFIIFYPSARAIKETIRKLSEYQEKSRATTVELSALYSSLEQAYQDLLEVDVVVKEYTVYAKCDKKGDFNYFSDQFEEVMEFEDDKPRNIFGWLNEQGYDKEYLNNIREMVLAGRSWSGEVKVVNNNGDFVWLKLNIVPAMDERGQVETLMIISRDETEKKEAEAISREINKERIEKKVKEQQFRSALILEGQEEERKRISRDMHDGVGQLLSAMKFNLEGIHSVGSDFEREKLDASKELLKNVIREVRRISFNLTPSALSDYGIVPVLNKFCREITKISDLQVTFENRTGFLSRLEGKVENNLYRIVQEAVNNAIKYAEAKEVKIILSHNSHFLYLEITDDGKGFDLYELEEKGHFLASGHGIFNIRERANFVNGQCEITSTKGAGTTISIHVPLE
jgi:two-component system sensor histidine kinase DegS